MDENKQIEKLSETGEKSADMVSGGISESKFRISKKKIKEICERESKFHQETHVIDPRIKDCFVYRAKEPISQIDENLNSGESLSEDDLSQVSGGTEMSTQSLNHDCLSHKPNFRNYHCCQKCGKEFNFIEHEAVRCNGAPPFCSKCKAEQSSTQK